MEKYLATTYIITEKGFPVSDERRERSSVLLETLKEMIDSKDNVYDLNRIGFHVDDPLEMWDLTCDDMFEYSNYMSDRIIHVKENGSDLAHCIKLIDNN